MKVRNVILVGFMGTGKSTVAAELAGRLGWSWVDLDAEIERHEGCTIAELFDRRGEAYFRRAETEALKRELAGRSGRVIATGGGAVLAEHNRRTMLENGLVVALTATPETIVRRVKGDPSRPLLRGDVEQRVRELLEKRKHAYDFAHVRIDTTDRTVSDIAAQIAELVEQASEKAGG